MILARKVLTDTSRKSIIIIMPELPEVETVCRGLAQILLGAKVISAETFTPKLRIEIPQDLNSEIKNRTIKSVNRKAKYILIELEGIIIIAHLGMSGRITIQDYESYTRKKHDHIVIELKLINGENKYLILNDPRRFGIFTLSSLADIDKHQLFSKLGIEPFSKEFTSQTLEKICESRTKNIKATIMDSSLLLGVGNIYASESLFRAGINPERASKSLSQKEIKELHSEILKTLEEAIAAGGSTLKDYSKANGESGYFQYNFKVYARESQPCPSCGRKILRIVQSNRSTFYCKSCQK